MKETIRRVNGYQHDAYTYYPVLIAGAGASGIAMACRLKDELGFDQFRIFDRQAGIGGTWWINRYPGVACDVYEMCSSSILLRANMPQSSCLLLILICPESKVDFLPPSWTGNRPILS